MIKKLVVLSLSILFLFGCSSKVELKTVKIGNFNWYTEQNSIEDIGKVAKKENKNILAVFSALWCGPCQQTKHDTFESSEFKEVADKVILLYVEQTEKKGNKLCDKYEIKGYPSFKMLNYKGEVIDMANLPNRKVKSFSKWIDDVNLGNTFFAVENEYNKNPNDLNIALKYVKRFPWDRIDEAIPILYNVLGENPDCTKEIVVDAVKELISNVTTKSFNIRDKKVKKEFMSKWDRIFVGNYKNCILNIKESLPSEMFKWQYRMSRWGEVEKLYVSELKGKKIIEVFPKGSFFATMAMKTYVNLNKLEKAEEIYNSYLLWGQNNKEKFEFDVFMNNSDIMAKAYLKEGDNAKSHKVLDYLFDTYLSLNNQNKLKDKRKNYYIHTLVGYSKEYKYGIDSMIKILDKEILNLKGMSKAKYVLLKAAMLLLDNKINDAKLLVENIGSDKELLASIKDNEKAILLNKIAWMFYKSKIISKKAAEFARQSLEIKKDPAVMDTLACLLSMEGKYKEAVKIEKEALSLSKNKSHIEDYKKNIKKWEKEIK